MSLSRRRRFLSVLAILAGAALAVPPARGLASDWSENPESRVRLVTPYRVAPEQGEIWLGIHFRLTPGWHVYWKNSGDAGFPPVIGLEETPEVTGAELLWPAPERYELPGGLVAFGYEDEVVYPVRAEVAAAGHGRVAITLALDYLVCRVDCVPYGYRLRIDQPVGPKVEMDPATAPLVERWRKRLPVPASTLPGIETSGRLDVGDLHRPVLTVTVAGAHAAPGHRPELFLEAHELFDPDRPELEESHSGLRFRVPLGVQRRLDEAPDSATFSWTVTGLAAPGGGEVALEARRTVPAGAGEEPTAAAAAAAVAGAVDRAAPSPVPGLLLAALAVVALLLALHLWGLLGHGGTLGGAARWREALGFLAAASVVGLLYLLSRLLDPESLAFVELSLLGLGLATWARRRAERPAARRAWGALAATAAAAALWLSAVG